MLGLPGIVGGRLKSAGFVGGTKSELIQVNLAQNQRAGIGQTLDGGGGIGGDESCDDPRGGSRVGAFDTKNIFDRKRNTCQ